MQEETGLRPTRLYNLSRVESFYRHRLDEVALVPVFAAFAPADADVRIGPEHDRYEWLSPPEARTRFSWPRERRAVDDIVQLLGSGDAGAVEDVLRVC
jgi:dihydroneopterin triphosphate diphosphatase